MLCWVVLAVALMLCGTIGLRLYTRSSDGWNFSELCAHEAGLLRVPEVRSGYADPLAGLRRGADEAQDRKNQLCITWRNEAILEILGVALIAVGVVVVFVGERGKGSRIFR
jgi:hypothetical protein